MPPQRSNVLKNLWILDIFGRLQFVGAEPRRIGFRCSINKHDASAIRLWGHLAQAMVFTINLDTVLAPAGRTADSGQFDHGLPRSPVGNLQATSGVSGP